MGSYKVKIFSSAKIDLKDIITYSPQAATRYYDLIIAKVGSLDEMPERCPYIRDLPLKAKGYRYLIIDNCLVFFVVKADVVQVRRIIYGKRHYEWLL